MSGDKNVNIVDIINKYKGAKYPTNNGVDDYTSNEGYIEYPRDERERNPIDVIDTDEVKPLDGPDYNGRVVELESKIAELSSAISDLVERVAALEDA